ncbi:formyltransferase [Sulfuritalea hydrogenivorans]|uniref:Formyl transferase domain-containing protein n=1 Tax=Sulfuritalea hydrogenivorans sk43H TaxID=1223802 RepID=W0SDN1_9PROT|nr:formyltransferase [Sulfuritalea hydrogenivorans]BAO29304.1 formyl transferase domain-containing protein [Sulfuritalea hydrogenivorans sk43H]
MSRAIVFAYHNVGVRCLSVLLAHGVDVVRVVTHQDSPNETIWFDSVAELAARHGIAVITPDDPNDPAVVAELAALQPDFLFSFYYRLMLKVPLLALPRQGAWNMHGSLLPKYRGRVPVNWAIIRGERETGATLHRMLEKPDAGDIVAQQAVPILPDDTAIEVFNKVTLAAEMALDRALPDLLAGRAKAKPQDLAAGSYFGGRKAEDGRIDWTRPAAEVHNLIRAVAPPYPGAYSDTPKGRLKVLRSLHPTGETGPHGGRPTLFSRDGRLYAECGDGRLLRLLAVELDALPLAPSTAGDQINATFGTPALSLS